MSSAEPTRATRDCVFCAIVAGTSPASEVYRDSLVTAFLDIRPVTPGHLLVVPNRHRTWLADLTADEMGAIVEAARSTAAGLRAVTPAAAGVNLFYADGTAAGQEVFHAHLHVIPRFSDDGFTVDAAAWRRPPPTRDELDVRALALRETLGRPTRAPIP